MREIDLLYGRSARCGKCCRLVVTEHAAHDRGGDFGDLVAIDKPQPVMGLYGQPVEKVQFWDLKDMVNTAKFMSGRGHHWRADSDGQIGDRSSFVPLVPLSRSISDSARE